MTSADRVQGVNQIQARGREVASIGTGKGNPKNLADVIGERPLRVREASHCRQSILVPGSLGLTWQAIYSSFGRSISFQGNKNKGEIFSRGVVVCREGETHSRGQVARLGWGWGGGADYYGDK